ncbi:D-isomer specific 2-hydroxyacid dehydrogenase family protein [Venturia nashicola]|nr:D-isomer specific 2-hydroxyacid dehydrogenase family protein [Venturia nashicola]
MASGTDTIDLQACKARGIIVSNCRGVNVVAVSEHAMVSILQRGRTSSRLRRQCEGIFRTRDVSQQIVKAPKISTFARGAGSEFKD